MNKIAAGEVIERPASVVKELVENAIDAGASRIDVAVEDGGRKLISVSDDGAGMAAEDLAMAFAPHATSKIACEDDLERIETMGFRGEALASIASVSHAHIRTRRREAGGAPGDAGGHEIEASGETLGPVRPCASAPGTTVTVRDLFFNTPARRKFMRTANTEMGHIGEQVARLALPHPQIAFSLTHNGRQVQKLPAADSTLQRAADLFGTETAQSLIPIIQRRGRVGVAGLISRPDGARATAQWQYFFLNGRYIRDRLLSHALREAYRGVIDPSRCPVALVFVSIDPAEVDVNVHPTKIEVRFRDSQAVHSELLASLRDTLNRANLSPTAMIDAPQAPAQSAADAAPPNQPSAPAAPLDETRPSSPQDQKRQASLRQALADFFRSTAPPQPRLGFSEPMSFRRPAPAAEAGTGTVPPSGTVPPFGTVPSCSGEGDNLGQSQTTGLSPGAIQIHNAYIIAACEDGLLIIDQHALHERLIYNDLKRRLEQGPLAGQRMLIPQTVQVTPAAAATLAARAELLARLGIEVVPFGPTAVAVQQFPSLLAGKGIQPAEFIRELIDKLAEDETADGERVLEDLLAMLACKAAVKAGDPLAAAEIESLLARRADASVEKASACPHGRPTTLKMTLRDLEKQFKRT